MRRNNRYLASALALACLAGAAGAENFPGPVDAAIIGDWQCGDTRVYITLLGSIELIDDGYTAGLIRAKDGDLRIEWDLDSSRTAWEYAVSEGQLTLMPEDAGDLRCRPRP